MKKILVMSLLMGAFVLTGCDPVKEDSYTNDQATITPEQLKSASSVTVYQENGKNINYIHTTTSIAAPVQWFSGVEVSAKPTNDFELLVEGAQTVVLTAMNPDGSLVKVDFPIVVDQISPNHPVDPHWSVFCGTSSKNWYWDDSEGTCWGNCGCFSATDGAIGGGWWGVSAPDIAEQVEGYKYGLNDSGSDAYMTFSLAGSSLIKSTGGKGTFSFDFSDDAVMDNNGMSGKDADKNNLWSIGYLNTTGDGILFPVQINTGTVVNKLYVNHLDDNKMILTYRNADTGAWGEATYWKFRAK